MEAIEQKIKRNIALANERDKIYPRDKNGIPTIVIFENMRYYCPICANPVMAILSRNNSHEMWHWFLFVKVPDKIIEDSATTVRCSCGWTYSYRRYYEADGSLVS